MCNWMAGDLAKLINDAGIDLPACKVRPAHIVDLIQLVTSGSINGKMAKQLLAESFKSGEMPGDIAKATGASQITDPGQVREIILNVLATYPDQVAKFREGNVGIKGFLVGQVMKESGGRANPGLVQQIIGVELEA